MAETTSPERPPEREPAGETPGQQPPRPAAQHPGQRPAVDLVLIRVTSTILAVLGVLTLLYFAASVFITLFSALILAFALEPLVHFFCVRTRLRRHFASGIVVFLFIAILYGVFYLAYLRAEGFLRDIPEIAAKIRSAPLMEKITGKARELNRLLTEVGQGIDPHQASPPPGRTEVPVILRDAESFPRYMVQGLGSLTNVIFSLSFIPFLVYFMLADREPLTRRTRELFPEEHREVVGEILLDVERMMRNFLLGNGMIAGILSGATVLVFLLVGLPYPVVLGVLSGTLSIVPYLGLIMALLPCVIVGLVTLDAPFPFLFMVACVTTFHLTAVNYLTPRLVGAEVHLNATSSTAALLFFGWLWGGMGLLLGIPILAVLKCVLDNIPSTRRLGGWLGDSN